MKENKNVFVFGIDDYNQEELKSIEHAEQYNFIPLFEASDMMILLKGELIDYEKIIQVAKKKLDQFEGTVDAIIGFFDPAMLPVFYLCQEYGLNGPGLFRALLCEHKYWSRLEQKKAIPGNIPDFTFLDPFHDQQLDDIGIKTPFWMKPVKSYGGQLGFKIENQKDLDNSLKQIRENIKYFAHPFNHMLSLADNSEMPEDAKKIDGNYCVAESLMEGELFTMEGFVFQGEVHQHGFFDSVTYKDSSCFFAYITPGQLTRDVQKRMMTITKKVIRQIRFDNTAFNIEFFYDGKQDQIWLLEINTRISQSHSEIFKLVHGSSNHQFLVHTATGQKPHMKKYQGKYKIAGKFHYRVFSKEGEVTSIPSENGIKQLEEKFDVKIFLETEKGQKLSELPGQDSFSSRLAKIHMGAQNKEELYNKYDKIIDKLNIHVQS